MPDYLQGRFPIVQKDNLARNCYSLWVCCPEMAAAAQPGQFAHLLAGGFELRRPISICEIDRERGRLRFVFEVRGQGTAALADRREGDLLDLIAPLGRGFGIREAGRAVLVGGGIGTPPMLELARRYGARASAVIGFRSAAAVILEDDFRRTGAQTLLCTDDGTRGLHGFVTGPLEDCLRQGDVSVIHACGPKGMLKGVVALADRYGVACEVSLEERMGCGVGACLVCACRCVKDGHEFYAHVCKDGPVFPSSEVLLDE